MTEQNRVQAVTEQWTNMAVERDDLQDTKQICRHYRALYGACSEDILVQRSPGYYSESELDLNPDSI